MSLNDWQLGELVAVQWNPEMAQRFPTADHAMCRQEFERREDGWHPFDPPHCIGWHCNRCGAGTSYQGHNDCPDRPQQNLNFDGQVPF